uniref:Uncharacterized protein n=1 Tax=Timema bartmani TaxID=61472 RepID=A0A7R9I7I2_9NEOP|nr:unnamed protein product [Timema bartmani]
METTPAMLQMNWEGPRVK